MHDNFTGRAHSINQDTSSPQIFALAVATVLLVALPVSAKPTSWDASITAAIDRSFVLDKRVPHHQLDVETQHGIVTLRGRVDNLLAKDRAVEQAQSIKGVRSVVDQIHVQATSVPDETLKRDVSDALSSDPATDDVESDVATSSGQVTLTGTVQSWAEKQMATDVVKTVKGVQSITNDLVVKAKAQRTDKEIQADVEARLRSDVVLTDRIIAVNSTDGHVELRGTVGSAREKVRATRLAYVMGVQTMNADALYVESWARNQMRRTASAHPSDDEIKRAVRDAFLSDPRVWAFDPVVEVKFGTVTLQGIVDNLAAKQAAKEDAYNTVGVRSVRNYLKVRPATPVDDETIARQVRVRLSNNPLVDRFDVRVSVLNGVVYLVGQVDHDAEIAQALLTAVKTKGVVDVKNRLTVGDGWNWSADYDIKDTIEDELWWSPFIDEDQVQVDVRNGVATLTGTVDSWWEKRVATDNAFEGGAKSVRNYLFVN
jgi:osmotically-inducible protein OsmY